MQYMKKTGVCALYKKEEEQRDAWVTLKQKSWWYKYKREKMWYGKKIGACILYKEEEKQCNIWTTRKQRILYKNGREKTGSLIFAHTTMLGLIYITPL